MLNSSTNKFLTRIFLLIAFLSIGFTAKADFEIDGKSFASTSWDATYSGSGECVFNGGWKGIGWWFGDVDLTSYTSLTVNFSQGTASKVNIKIEFTDGSTEEHAENAGATSITLSINASKAVHVKQIYLQTENACTVYISNISLAGTTSYTLTLTDDGNGTATSNQANNASIAGGTSVTVTANPSTGYKFVAWVDGDGNSVSTSKTYTFTMDADKSLQATFAAAQQYTLTLNIDDASHGSITGGGTHYEGEQITIVATSASGWSFDKWADFAGGAVSLEASYTFTMPGNDLTLTAHFFEVGDCLTSITLQCEDFVSVTIVDDNEAKGIGGGIERKSQYNAYGTIVGNGYYTDFKSTDSEIFLPFSVSSDMSATYAANVSFVVRHANTGNGRINIWREVPSTDTHAIEYDGKCYVKHGYYQFSNDKKSSWTNSTAVNWSVMPGESGRWLVSIHANDYAAVDQITITSPSSHVLLCDYIPVPIPTHALTVNTDPADGSWGTAVSDQADNTAIEEGASVTVTATPAAGKFFSCWKNGSTKLSNSPTYGFTMPTGDLTLTAVFTDVQPTIYCASTLRIEAENFAQTTVKSNATATSAETVAEQGTPKYGAITGLGIAWFKGSTSEVYYPFSVSDAVGNCTFTVRLADAKDTYINLWELSNASDYDIKIGSNYYKKYDSTQGLTATEYGQTWETPSATWNNLPIGSYVVSVYGKNWTAIDHIDIESSNASTSFCVDVKPSHNVTGVANNATYGTVSPSATTVEEGRSVTLRATPEDGYAFVCWESDDITLTDEQKHKSLLSVAMGTTDIAVTANFAAAYVAWPWHDGISEWNVTKTDGVSDKGNWDNQVTLGPEHFTTAVVGGKILVKVSDMQSNPQGAFQNTVEYNTIDKNGKAYDEASGLELYSGWEEKRDSLGSAWDFNLSNGNFYHTITATSLAELKENGVIIKGQFYTISEIQIIGNCEHRTMRSAPDVTIAHIVYDYTATTTTNNYVWWPGFPDASKKGVDEFCFGNWEHKLKFPASAFAQISVGDIIRIRVRQVDPDKRCRISYRCDIPWIDALANQTTHKGQTVKTTGDIEFDRTITNLGGDAPDPEGYVDMRVDADMLTRLQETGLIIFGENACLSMVEICHGPYIIYSDQERYVPKCGVDSLIIYQGGQALNTDSVKIYAGVEYIRPAVGGKHGNLLEHWYTFTMPFPVSTTQVYDEIDKEYFDINTVYYKDGDVRDNPTGNGYYYLQQLTTDGDNTGIEEIFRARWDYLNYQQPKLLTPYIIMFTKYYNSYFATNPTVKFCGGPCSIAGINQIVVVPSDGVEYWMYPNNTMHEITISGSAYTLNEATNLFELNSNPTIAPFECYVQATAGFKALHPVIAHPGYRGSAGSATGVSQVANWSLSIMPTNGSAILLSAVDQEIRIYSAVGQMVSKINLQAGVQETISLPRGTYIISAVDGPRKVMF